MLPYPFSYFSTIFQPRAIFSQRRQLTLWQRFFTTIFLIALLVIPASLQTASLTTYPLDTFVEGVYRPLTEEVVSRLHQQVQLADGRLTYTGQAPSEQVTLGEQVSSSPDFSYQFQEEELTIRKGDAVLAQLTYHTMTQEDFSNRDRLTHALSQVWYQQNRLLVSLSLTLVSAAILTMNLLFVLLGASFFLYLTKKSKLFHFQTFAECVTVSLSCLGLPTLLVFLAGILGQPVTTVLTIQNILFVLMLIWVFFKTKFRDEI